jgi:manganese/zinc/iron transport system permease protein
VVLLFKELKLVAFDAEFALSQGWPALAIDLAMMAMVAAVTIAGLPIVGAILIAALLILPSAAARMWTNRLHWMLVLAGGFGAAAGAGGARLSRDLPTGPTIILTAAAIFFVSILMAPGRGMLSRLWAESRLRVRVAREHLMRSLFELNEPQLPALVPLPLEHLRQHRTWRPWMLNWLLQTGEREGLIEVTDKNVTLTSLGLRRAAETARTHRLWEMYMMNYVGSAPDHVDRSADDVEHLLPAELVVEMEEKLAQLGRLPATIPDVPSSPHVIEEPAVD